MRSSFHIISGDRKLSKLEKVLYRASHALEKILDKKTVNFPVEIYRPLFLREKYVAAFGEAALDMSSSRVLCLNFLLEHGGAFFGPDKAVADLGCGSGRYADFIKNAHGYRSYIGYDLHENSEWKTRASETTRFATAVLGEDRIDVSGIDTVFSQSVLEHVREDKSVFHNFRSSVSKSVQHLHLIPAIKSYACYKFHGYRRYGLRQVQSLLRSPGLSDIKIYALGNDLTRALFRDHYGKLGAINKNTWVQKCAAYRPDQPMFDNLAYHREKIQPHKASEAEFFVLLFRQFIKGE